MRTLRGQKKESPVNNVEIIRIHSAKDFTPVGPLIYRERYVCMYEFGGSDIFWNSNVFINYFVLFVNRNPLCIIESNHSMRGSTAILSSKGIGLVWFGLVWVE